MSATTDFAARTSALAAKGDIWMSALSDGPKIFREKRFQRIIDDAETDMQARQDKAILSTEIKSLQRDIAYLKDQLEVLLAQREALQTSISTDTPENAALRQQVERLQAEKRIVTGREGLESLELNLTKMAESLPGMRSEILRLESEVQSLPPRAAVREAQLTTLRQQHGTLETALEAYRTRLLGLEEEIAVITSTRDIITGLIPANFDPESVGAIQANLEETFNQYLHDAQDDIEFISAQTEALKAESLALQEETHSLSPRRDALRRTAKALPTQEDSSETPDALAAEVALLKEHSTSAARRQDAVLKELAVQRSVLGELDEQLAQARERHSAAQNERDRLWALKELLGDAADIDAETKRLRGLALAHASVVRADENMLQEGMVIANRLGALNDRLSTASERLRPVFEEAVQLAGFSNQQ